MQTPVCYIPYCGGIWGPKKYSKFLGKHQVSEVGLDDSQFTIEAVRKALDTRLTCGYPEMEEWILVVALYNPLS